MGMAQEFLYGTDISAIVEEMSGKGVAQRMRGCFEARGGDPEVLIEGSADASIRESSAEFIEEDSGIGGSLVFGGEFRPAVAQIVTKRFDGRLPHQRHPLL